MFLINIFFLIRDVSCNIPIFGEIVDSPLSLALLHDAMVVVVIKTHHNHGLVFSVHCMAIYVIRNFTGRLPIISFKQRLLSLD